MKKFLISLAAVTTLSTALFASNGFYAGASIGKSSNTDSYDEKGASYGAIIGYDMTQNLGVEFNYNNFSKGEKKTGLPGLNFEKSIQSIGAAVVVKYPFADYVIPYGKLGYQRYDIEVEIGGTTKKVSDSDVYYGGGIQSNITEHFSTRLSFDRYMMNSDLNISNYSFALLYRF